MAGSRAAVAPLRGGCLERTRTSIPRVTTGRPTVERQGSDVRWCPREETKPRPSRCERAALATELLGHGAEGPNCTAAAQGFNLPLYWLSYLGMSDACWSWRRDSHPRCIAVCSRVPSLLGHASGAYTVRVHRGQV